VTGDTQGDRAGGYPCGNGLQSGASPTGQDSARNRDGRSFVWSASDGGVSDAVEIERAVGAFAHESNGGLIVVPNPVTISHRELIITLAAHQHRLPVVYAYRYFVADGGLISYGPDFADQYRQAGRYVDRILKGEKPADLPVQAPTKYELVINLRTAKAIGLDVTASLLARADEVIE
jgi:putative tryptophan/tyrosine transport system substrate-binding protein